MNIQKSIGTAVLIVVSVLMARVAASEFIQADYQRGELEMMQAITLRYPDPPCVEFSDRDPMNGRQFTVAYECEAIHRAYDPKTGFCK